MYCWQSSYIYASSIPELTKVQSLLQLCFKRKYSSYQIDIYHVLEEVDRSPFKKISSMPGHPLYPSVLKTKESSTLIRVPSSQLPRVNTQRFKNTFLIGYYFFKYRHFKVLWILNVKFNASTCPWIFFKPCAVEPL